MPWWAVALIAVAAAGIGALLGAAGILLYIGGGLRG